MDVDLWLRIMERYGPCVTITQPLFGKRLEPGSIIFNPQTSSINQVPRVLARQRLGQGKDDVQDGKSVNIEEYRQKGLISTGGSNEKRGLFLGAIVTCLWLNDWKGARTYWNQMVTLTEPNSLSKINLMFVIIQKLLQRIRNNPYKRFTIHQEDFEHQ